jgi:Mat/Ecp fimbriae major subunit
MNKKSSGPREHARGIAMMNDRIFKGAMCAAALSGVCFAATSAQADTVSATARAKILSDIALSNTSDLDYGTIVTATSISIVTVSSAGVRTCGAGLTCLASASAANFDIAGTTGQTVTISVPPSVTLTSGSDTMLSTLLASTPLVTIAAGAGSFSVGGILFVGASQAEGVYTGTFTATVNYQ